MEEINKEVCPIDITVTDSSHCLIVKGYAEEMYVRLDVHTPLFAATKEGTVLDDELKERVLFSCGFMIGYTDKCKVSEEKSGKVLGKDIVKVNIPSDNPLGVATIAANISSMSESDLTDFERVVCTSIPGVSKLYTLMVIQNSIPEEKRSSEENQRRILRGLLMVEHPEFFTNEGRLTPKGRDKLTTARNRMKKTIGAPMKKVKRPPVDLTGRKDIKQG